LPSGAGLANVGKVLSEVANASECKIVKVDVDDYPELERS